MGRLLNGKWVPDEDFLSAQSKADGGFQRSDSQFRSRISADGSSGFPAEPGRYHLYVAYACPWACRTIIFRKIKGLESVIGMSIVDPVTSQSWSFGQEGPETADPLYGLDYLHQIYTRAQTDYNGRVTVPVLWDKVSQTIVNNESAEIIRIFNSEFNAFANPDCPDLYPEELREQIKAMNELVYPNVNNGVYKAGFAKTQAAYDEAFEAVFSTLDRLEKHLGKEEFLVGGQITEADWRLFTTLVRFDSVYVCLFKCNKRRLMDYPNLSQYAKKLYDYPGVKETVNFDHIKRHYYGSMRFINPFGIVPRGPEFNL